MSLAANDVDNFVLLGTVCRVIRKTGDVWLMSRFDDTIVVYADYGPLTRLLHRGG
jgi:hypothetical protein